jgi:hypothetical protein
MIDDTNQTLIPCEFKAEKTDNKFVSTAKPSYD